MKKKTGDEQNLAGGDRDLVAIRRRLLAWYRANKRDLPWRKTQDPYRIWISEIMLQQTRVAAALPYYARFLARFPNVQSLAEAPQQDLLAAWAGLGYYSRARNVQKAARAIHELGEFPTSYSALLELPGVGDYTAAAVASIALGLPHAVMDGNVARVLSRVAAEPGDIKSNPVRKRLRVFAGELLDRKRPGEFNQALMELGAIACVPRRPMCETCPIREHCKAQKLGLENQLPVRAAQRRGERHEKKVLVIEKAGHILFWQRPGGSTRLADFWELPESGQLPAAKVTKWAGAFRHTIVNTTYLVEVCQATVRCPPREFQWLPMSGLADVPVSTTARKALALAARA
jgi:A/G-specific adenine glycosylase